MRYYAPRRKKSGGWHFTCMHGDDIYPVGNCRNCHPHATADEAVACYGEYLLTKLEFDPMGLGKCTQQKCEHPDCEEFTHGVATIRHTMTMKVLCNKHRNKEGFLKVWSPPRNIAAS